MLSIRTIYQLPRVTLNPARYVYPEAIEGSGCSVSLVRDQFVSKVFRQLLDQGYLHAANNLLVVAGGRAERELFRSLSFTNVTITNLDSVEAAEHLEPFQWACEDAQHLSYSPCLLYTSPSPRDPE